MSRSSVIGSLVQLAVLSCSVTVVASLALPAMAQTNASAYTTGYRYDVARRLVGTIHPDPDGAGVVNYAAVRNTYNSNGLLSKVETGELASWQSEAVLPSSWAGFTVFRQVDTTFDSWGRKLTEKLSSAGTAYSLTQYTYDTAGRVQCTAQRMNTAAYASPPASACTLGTEGTEGPDRITRQTYDTLSRVLKVQKAYATPLQNDYATYTYYSGGPLESTKDANGNYSYYAYDGLVRQQYWYFPSKAVAGEYSTTDYEKYTYDLNGNRTALRKRDGKSIAYEYDKLNRLTRENFPTGTISDVYYGYDLRNLQLYARFDSSAPTATGLTSTFDEFGRPETASTNQSGGARTLNYLHDAEGNRTRVTHPDGKYFAYSYDGLNRLKLITENNATTALATITYDNQGRRQTLARGASVSSTGYGYDGVSRLKTLTQNLSTTAYDETRTFTHNPAGQIVSRNLSNNVYVFDQVSAAPVDYTVNGLNQYTKLVSAGTVSPTHDANGNMTSDGSTTYSYDVLNRLTSSVDSLTVTMSYDPKGRLFQTTSTGAQGTKQYLYDGDALVAEYSSAGTLLRRYVHGSGVDEPLIWYEGSAVGSTNRRYYHSDHQGSVIAATDSAGAMLKTNTYDPYGVPDSANSTRFQYTGQIMVPDLGLYYYKARIYNPALGRFMQTDPIGYKDDLGLYTYVGNSPLERRDPTGKFALSVEVCFAACGGITIGYRVDTTELSATYNAGLGFGGGASVDLRPNENGSAGSGVAGGRSNGIVANAYSKAGVEFGVGPATLGGGLKVVGGRDFANGKDVGGASPETSFSKPSVGVKAVFGAGGEVGAYLNVGKTLGAINDGIKTAVGELKANFVDPAAKAISFKTPEESYWR